ncbi:MAG: exodeoxyribonuclease VII small subunit [Candidatus Omnitrophica bacterium]|nr:exodeoxyribonuclease VII small subunit [Candidatus Omnitrophota bacterium]
MSQEGKEMEFEAALKKLEDIVGHLETGDLSLEAALKQYEEGVRMADICSKRLSEAQKRVEILIKTGAGKFKTVPFEPKKKK